jgi:DNA-directed RNA polymerase subunit L
MKPSCYLVEAENEMAALMKALKRDLFKRVEVNFSAYKTPSDILDKVLIEFDSYWKEAVNDHIQIYEVGEEI